MGTSPPQGRPAGLRLPVHPHPTDPLVAVARVPQGLTIDRHSVVEDGEGQRYAYATPEEFERFAEVSPFTQHIFAPRGYELHVLPPDTKALYLKR